MFSISTRFSPVSASSGSIHHKRYMPVHTEFGKGSTTGSKAMNRLAAVQILRRSNQRKGISKQPIFLSAPLLPFPCISACGSGCGSKLPHTLTHRLNLPKSKEKVLFSLENRTFWSCWADSNRRPHPYQWDGDFIKAYYSTIKPAFWGCFLLLFVPFRSLSVRPVLQRQ